MPSSAPQCRLTKRRILWSVAALLALLVGWQVYDILTGKPEPRVDYATPFYELCVSAQPEGENAWPLHAKTMDHIGEVSSAAFKRGGQPPA